MGLDIMAYKNLVRLSAEAEKKIEAYRNGGKWNGPPADEYDNAIHIDARQFMPARLAGLAPGWYARGQERVGFRAGSYSGYSRWRNQLCSMALGCSTDKLYAMKEDELAGRPFVELIYFSDCEGVIGPEVSAKLHKDFVAHKKHAEEFAAKMSADEGAYFMKKYGDWTSAFEVAAQGGCVNFC